MTTEPERTRDFEREKADFLAAVLPLMEGEFRGAGDKAPFLRDWMRIVGVHPFCRRRFSFRDADSERDDDDWEMRPTFRFRSDFRWVDCNRDDEWSDCLSGRRSFPFGEERINALWLHADSPNVASLHETDALVCDGDVDDEVLRRARQDPCTFEAFVEGLIPELVHATLTDADDAGRFLEIEADGACVRYASCILARDDPMSFGRRRLASAGAARTFVLAYLELNAAYARLDLASCSEDLEADIAARIGA